MENIVAQDDPACSSSPWVPMPDVSMLIVSLNTKYATVWSRRGPRAGMTIADGGTLPAA
jgi:hypothetical protein